MKSMGNSSLSMIDGFKEVLNPINSWDDQNEFKIALHESGILDIGENKFGSAFIDKIHNSLFNLTT